MDDDPDMRLDDGDLDGAGMGEVEGGGVDDIFSSMIQKSAIEQAAENVPNYVKTEVTVKPNGQFAPKIMCIYCLFQLGVELNFHDLFPRIRIMEYTPSKFGGASLFCAMPEKGIKAHARLSSKGSVSMFGLKSFSEGVYVAKKICKLFRKVGVKRAKVQNFHITHMMVGMNLSVPVRINEMKDRYPEWVHYEPEVFPGLRVRLLNPRCAVSIFANGKVILTGVRTEGKVLVAAGRLLPLVRPFMGNGSDQGNASIAELFRKHTVGEADVKGFKATLNSTDIEAIEAEDRNEFVHDLLQQKGGNYSFHNFKEQATVVKSEAAAAAKKEAAGVKLEEPCLDGDEDEDEAPADEEFAGDAGLDVLGEGGGWTGEGDLPDMDMADTQPHVGGGGGGGGGDEFEFADDTAAVPEDNDEFV